MTLSPPESWTIGGILRWTTDYLREKEVPEPRPSAEVLLAHCLDLTRLDLYLKHDQPLTPEELGRFRALVVRRRQGEPVAYIVGHKEFWSLNFLVTPAVLIPRPETETLVEATLEVAKDIGGGGQGSQTPASSPKPPPPTPYRGLGGEPLLWGCEVGVGSGAVVIALAKELPSLTWLGLDFSGPALAVARENARRHGVAQRLHLLQGHLLAPLKPDGRFALMVANLPYVSRADWEALPRGIREFEPKEALLGGEDGLDLLRPLAREAHAYLARGGWLALELGPGQAGPISHVLEETGAYDRLEFVKDYLRLDRVVRARRTVAR
jgi:release factor glutamine methyltransferase